MMFEQFSQKCGKCPVRSGVAVKRFSVNLRSGAAVVPKQSFELAILSSCIPQPKLSQFSKTPFFRIQNGYSRWKFDIENL